jgi:16S rRNA G966 N2-methylase RsmD
MKYMGSKRWMLANGLGELVVNEAMSAERFVDLFSGSAAVSWHVATRVDVPVMAVDLQTYSRVLADAVIRRTTVLDATRLREEWGLKPAPSNARDRIATSPATRLTVKAVHDARISSAKARGMITRAYGGHYFSPSQARAIDRLLATLPRSEPARSACLGALIWAAGRCAAAPGHTAQPFQPTKTALPSIADAWGRDVTGVVSEVLPAIASQSARRKGSAIVADAIDVARSDITCGDVVFIDPPYSAAQYSRFYHVLETIARGSVAAVAGVGRYPPPQDRPKSRFSLKTESRSAFSALLDSLRETQCRVLMTFPQSRASNGLSGEEIVATARDRYEVDVVSVVARHSTLGGNNDGRASRRQSRELIMAMQPRRRSSKAKPAAAGKRR